MATYLILSSPKQTIKTESRQEAIKLAHNKYRQRKAKVVSDASVWERHGKKSARSYCDKMQNFMR